MKKPSILILILIFSTGSALIQAQTCDDLLSLHKPTITSSDESASLTGNYAVDGDLSTRWSSAWSDPQWIYIDLIIEDTVNRIILTWEAAYGTTYEIQVSKDAVNWATVFSESSGDGGTDDISFADTAARYVRMYGTSRVEINGWYYGYSLYEFEVYGCLGPVEDADEDGYTTDVDCDDNNPDIYPGAEEICNGLDNNCDGRIDCSTEVEIRSIESTALGMNVNYNVYYPPSYYTESDSSYPVLYLLHGIWGNNNDWTNNGMKAVADEETEEGRTTEMIIIMPDGMDAFYCNNYDNRNLLYEDFMVEELIPHIDQEFRTIPNGKYRAIAGLSMGGYGSTFHGFKYDTMYSSAYAMSGAFDAGGPNLYAIVNSKPVSSLPAFAMEIGTEDPLVYNSNTNFRDFLLGKGFDFEYIERPGTHDWNFWMGCLPKALRFATENFGNSPDSTGTSNVVFSSTADVNIYPNPATLTLTVHSGSGKTVRLLTITGTLLDSRPVENSVAEFDVSKLPKGIFIIVIKFDDRNEVHKIIVQ